MKKRSLAAFSSTAGIENRLDVDAASKQATGQFEGMDGVAKNHRDDGRVIAQARIQPLLLGSTQEPR
jgi:hypothetical protein